MRTPKLTKQQAELVRTRYQAEGAKSSTARKLGEEFGVSAATIRRVIANPEYGKPESFAVAPRGGNMTEIGTGGLKRWGGTIDEDYLKDWRTLNQLVQTVKRMLDHPTIGAITFAVEAFVRNAEWTVQPAGKEKADEEAAAFVKECLGDMSHSFHDHLLQAISFAWYGFAPFEIVYKRRLGPDREPSSSFDDGLIGWRKFGFRPQDSLAPGKEWDFDDNGGVQAMNQNAPPDHQERKLPIEKLILYRTGAHKNNPQGRSVLRSSFVAWYFSKNLSEVEGISAERMGSGLPVFYLGEDTSKSGANSDFELAKQAVRNIRVDEQAGLVLPYPKMGGGAREGKGMLFELVAPPSRGIIDFNEVINRYNQQIAQTVLAQFVFFGISERGTQSLGTRMTDVFHNALQGWLSMIASTLNLHAIPRLLRLNASKFSNLTGYPTVEFSRSSDADLTGFMEALKMAVDAGALKADVEIERTVRNMLNLPELTDDMLKEREAQEEEDAKRLAEAKAALGQQQEQQMPAKGKMPDEKVDLGEDEEKGLKAVVAQVRRLVERLRA